jgi:hypothetical protein
MDRRWPKGRVAPVRTRNVPLSNWYLVTSCRQWKQNVHIPFLVRRTASKDFALRWNEFAYYQSMATGAFARTTENNIVSNQKNLHVCLNRL